MTDYEKIYNFENLYRAYRKARQGKRWKGAAAKFEVNLLEALNLLRYQLQTKKYTLSPYNTFECFAITCLNRSLQDHSSRTTTLRK